MENFLFILFAICAVLLCITLTIWAFIKSALAGFFVLCFVCAILFASWVLLVIFNDEL